MVKASPLAKYPWVMQLAGALVVIITLLEAYWYYTVQGLALSLEVVGYGLVVGIAVFSAVVFVAMMFYKKRRGVDIILAFREIPPE